ncbi:MAG: sterol desaturase family protein [Deltaproteobacteria bacterium]|nr:sterol desaturase family protein [Deltaproteobacteria bacterium]
MNLRQLVSITVFPVTFLVTHGIAIRALAAGVNPTGVIAAITAATVVLVVALERVLPFDPDWNRARGDVLPDALHNVFSTIVTAQLCQAALLVALAPLAGWLAARTGASWWPLGWSLTAQTALAFAISELGAYWAHRVGHETDLGWRLHSVHHSPTRLYWLNAARDNPLGVVLLYVPSVAPLVMLGAPPEMFTMIALFNAVVGLFQHANIDIRLGPLNYVFSVLEVHRWHHSTVVSEANHNYGSNLMVFDVLFGTVYRPRDRRAPDAIGIGDLPDFPTSYLGQLAVPLRWRAISAARATDG